MLQYTALLKAEKPFVNMIYKAFNFGIRGHVVVIQAYFAGLICVVFQPLQALIAGEEEDEECTRSFYVLSDTQLQKWLMSPYSPEKVSMSLLFVFVPLMKFSGSASQAKFCLYSCFEFFFCSHLSNSTSFELLLASHTADIR